MGFICDLTVNRECENCAHGEYDLLERKFYCNLREEFREPEDTESCADLTAIV